MLNSSEMPPKTTFHTMLNGSETPRETQHFTQCQMVVKHQLKHSISQC